jgi:hypothetical protein
MAGNDPSARLAVAALAVSALSWACFFIPTQLFCHWDLFLWAFMVALAAVSLWIAVRAWLAATVTRMKIAASGVLAVSLFGLLGSFGVLALPTMVLARMSPNDSETLGLLRRLLSAEPGSAPVVPSEAHGYLFTRVNASPAAWAVQAVPAISAAACWPKATGHRSFCADATGRICDQNGGTAPAVVDGRCLADCHELQSARPTGDAPR